MKNLKWLKILSFSAVSTLIMSSMVHVPAVYATTDSEFSIVGTNEYYIGKEKSVDLEVKISGQDYDPNYKYRVIVFQYPQKSNPVSSEVKRLKTSSNECNLTNGQSCGFSLSDYENISTGTHQIGAVIEKSNSNLSFNKKYEEVDSLADLGEIVSEVAPHNRYYFEKMNSNPTLSQSSRYFTSDLLSDQSEHSPQIFIHWNSYNYEDKYTDYVYDVTNDKIKDIENSMYGLDTYYYLDQTNDDYMQYQIIRAKTADLDNVKSKDDLEDIQYESNIIEFERRLWSINDVYAMPDGEDRPEVDYSAGGGEQRSIYLEDNTTGEIIWSNQDETRWDNLLDWKAKPNYGHIPVDDISWATYWVADSWEGNFSKRPIHISELKNKIANNKGLEDSIPESQSGIQDPKQVAGGSNSIEPCIVQDCHGDPINSFTGEFFETATDLRGIGNAMIPDSTRSFSTIRKDELGIMGYGWRNAYELKLESNGSALSGDEAIRFIQENGATSYFEKQDDGSYKTSASVDLTLLDNGKFEMFNKLDLTTMIFSGTGKFEKVTDRNGNSLNVSYENGKIAKALSSNGSYINFEYNANGLLSKSTSDTGDTAVYKYNPSKQLISVTNQDGAVFSYTYDNKRRVKTLTNPLGGVTTNTYNADNRVTRQLDPLGGNLRFAYEGEGLNRTTTITNPNGLKIRNIYQDGYLVAKIESPDTAKEKKWSYSYDRNNNLTATIAPDGSMISSTYDNNHNPLTIRNSLGGIEKYAYNHRGQVLTIEDNDGNLTQNLYDAKGNLLETTDALGNITKYNWGMNGELLSVIDPRGVSNPAKEDDYKTLYSYTNKGLLESTVNPVGGVLSHKYDAKGRAIEMTTPNGNATPAINDYTSKIEYGSNNLPLRTSDADNNETAYTYDPAGNVLTSTDAMGNVSSFTYDLMGQLLTATNADGTTSYEYNLNGEIVKTIDPKGNISINEFDTSGNLTKTTDAKGNATTYSYDIAGNLVQIKDPMGGISTFNYDTAGNLVSSVDSEGHISGTIYDKQGKATSTFDNQYKFTSYSYDSLGRNTKIELPNGAITELKYDEAGNTVERTNGEGDSEYWDYDSLNRVINYTDQEGKVESNTYDRDSNPITVTRGDNSVISTEYNQTGRVLKVDYQGTSRDVSYEYDSNGRVTSEKLGNGIPNATSYDHAGRILSKNGISYEYDKLGNQTKITYPSGRTLDHTYDNNSNLTTANISGVGTVSYTYDKNNNLISTELPNGVTENNTLDSLGRVTGMTMNNTTQEIHKFTKTYDSLGNIAGSTYGLLAQEQTEKYRHDTLNRLTNVSSSITGNNAENDYNLANHLVKFESQNVTSDKTGKPTQIGTQGFEYSILGNRTSSQDSTEPSRTKTYEWSIDNLLSQTANGNNPEVTYEYDARGLLSKRTENSQSDNFVWDETSINALLINDGDYEYVYGANRVPVAQIDLTDNSIEYLHTDTNGSVIALTGVDGYLAGITNYGAYGKRQGSAISRFGFAGEWVDPTTEYTYLRARWYDPSTGHFLSKDPLYEITQEAYGYANGNPLLNIDPSGLFVDPTNITNLVVDQSKPVVNDLLTPGGAINIDESLKKNVSFVTNFAKDTGIMILENSGYISATLMVAGVAAGGTIVGAPVAPIFLGFGAGMGAISAGFEISKCAGLRLRDYHTCDPFAVGISLMGTVTGGTSTGISKIVKLDKIDIDNLSFNLSIIGAAETGMATAWQKLKQIAEKGENAKKC